MSEINAIFSVNTLENPADKDKDQLAVPLTKQAHRNPDIHQRGDTLPESLLEYSEGGAFLGPDIAGNSPKMSRAKQLTAGNGAVQNCTTSQVQAGTFSQSVSCPPQAGTGAFVRVTYAIDRVANGAGGPNLNASYVQVNVGGSLVLGSRTGHLLGGTGNSRGDYSCFKSIDVPINAGQTLTIQVVTFCLTVTTPQYSYQLSMGNDSSFFQTELFY